MDKKKLLMVCDFVAPTGFAQVAHNLAERLRHTWDIDVLAINYHGDAHTWQKKVHLYPASAEGDVYGLKSFPKFVASQQYDLVFILNDIWIINMYLDSIQRFPKDKKPPIIFYTTVDAQHIKPEFIEPLQQANHGVFYTEFGLQEAQKAGLSMPTSIISHGVDTSVFYPMQKEQARAACQLSQQHVHADWFIMLMVDRNTIRKRLDLGIYYFSEWIRRTKKPETVKLYYHGVLRDQGPDLLDLVRYYGIDKHFILTHPDMNHQNMVSLDHLRHIYNSADVFFKPTCSEGWGLTLSEAMACGVPSLCANSSALGEWPKGHVEYIDIIPNLPFVNQNSINTIMDTISLDSFIEKAEKLYNDKTLRKTLGYDGFLHMQKEQFQWKCIAGQFEHLFNQYTPRENK